jgi:alpha-kinase family protein
MLLISCYSHHVVHQVNKNAFRCAFYEIPAAKYDYDNLPHGALSLDDSDIRVHHGTLCIDFDPRLAKMGSFKTSHPGKVQLDANFEVRPFTNGTVCVKQMYERKDTGSGAISRLKGSSEYNAVLVKCNCIKWASILMDLTYQYIAREVKKNKGGEPPYPIPTLRFTRVMIAIVHDLPQSKVFLVEEWIDTDDGDHQFIKYLNNRAPYISDSVSQAPKTQQITDFLIFAQHIQWQKSRYLAFTSDFQGAGELLTDPQITSNPYV